MEGTPELNHACPVHTQTRVVRFALSRRIIAGSAFTEPTWSFHASFFTLLKRKGLPSRPQAASRIGVRRTLRSPSSSAKSFDLRIGQFVGQSDRHLGQPEFAGGFKPEMPVNNRAVRFGHDRNPEPEFPNSGGHLINLGVILARIARVFNRPIDRPLLDLQWTCHAAAVSFIESI